MENKNIILAIITIIILIFAIPTICVSCNGYNYYIQKIDDATNYKTIKKVEDTCRSMISSYEADKLTYEQYKNSNDKEQLEWAQMAKMRANKTASSYNNYVLENSFIWSDSVPEDIKDKLDYLE